MASPKSSMVLPWLCLILSVTELGAVPILLANGSSVGLLDSEHPNEITFLTTDRDVVALDYHIGRGELYFSDKKSGTTGISKMSIIKGTHENSTWMLPNSYAGSIAVDWINDKLYWTSGKNDAVETATLDGLNHKVVFDQFDGGSYASCIVVDPYDRLLFWRTSMMRQVTSGRTDGSHRQDLHSSIRDVLALTLDISRKELYIRAALGLYSSSYDGSDLKKLFEAHDPITTYNVLAHYSNKIYYPDYNEEVIKSFNLETNQTDVVFERKKVMREGWLFDMKILHSSVQPQLQGASQCKKKCSHFCNRIITSSCECPHGFILDHDEITCKYEGVQSGKQPQ